MSIADPIQVNGSSVVGRTIAQESAIAAATVRCLEIVCEVCLVAIIFVVPLMMAVIRETGVAVFVGCSLLMSVAWAIGQLIRPDSNSRFSVLILVPACGVALVAAQLLPLPEWLLHFASPFFSDQMAIWNDGHVLLNSSQAWSRLSLTPSMTRSGLVLLTAYVLFFLTLSHRLRTLECIDRVLKMIAASTVLMAFVGLGQLFFGNGQFLWMFEHPFRDASWPAKATFTNQNHFAHFLALGIGPLAWVWKLNSAPENKERKTRGSSNAFGVRRTSSTLSYVLGGLIAVVLLAGVLSFSRGGVSVLLIASAISMVAAGKRLQGVAKMAVPVVAFIVLGVLVFGTEALENKWNSITGAETVADLSIGRFALWSALLDAFPNFWLAGSGVGSHAEVYPTWLTTDFSVRFSHAESGYMQILIEAGLLGVLLVFAGIGSAVFWAMKALKAAGADGLRRARVLILVAGVSVSVLHSIADFVWFIPACTTVAIMILACLFRTHQLYSQSADFTHSGWPSIFAMIVVLAAVPVGSLSAEVVRRDMMTEAPWEAYREEAVASARRSVLNSTGELDDRLDKMIGNLEQCLQHDDSDFRAMSELAALYLRRFEREQKNSDNPMSIREIKNTVETSGFESQAEVAEWLQRAFGSHVVDLYRSLLMAENAVAGQPMRGECYLVLAQVGFLKQLSVSESQRLVEQAIRLRPYNSGVLYFAGLVEAEKGDVDAACRWWKKAFHQSAEIQPLILQGLENHLSPSEIVGYLDPEVDSLWLMFDNYRRQGNVEYRDWTADYYRAKFSELIKMEPDQPLFFWTRSEQVFELLGEPDIATQCLGRAVKASPHNFAMRKRYALALLSIQKYDSARRELNWCRLKSPDDVQITEALVSLREQSGKGRTSGY